MSTANDIVTVTALRPASESEYTGLQGALSKNYLHIPYDHKVYISCDACSSAPGTVRAFAKYESSYTICAYGYLTAADTWTRAEAVLSPTYEVRGIFFGEPDNATIGQITKFKNLNLIDLTALFGAGNEPTSVAEFKKMFPADYYPYCNTLNDVAVLYSAQSRTQLEKALARSNIEARDTSLIAENELETTLKNKINTAKTEADNAVSFTSQSLTEELKAQARTNIGARNTSLIAETDLTTALKNKINNGFIDLLWTNASPNSAFAPQSINVGTNNQYVAYLIEYCFEAVSYSPKTTNSVIVYVAGNTTMAWHYNGLTDAVVRDCSYYSGKISFGFGLGYKIGVEGSSYMDNSYIIPYKIYGIK